MITKEEILKEYHQGFEDEQNSRIPRLSNHTSLRSAYNLGVCDAMRNHKREDSEVLKTITYYSI